MIKVRFDENGRALNLVVEPPKPADLGYDPALATDRLFAILGPPRGRAGEAGSELQSTQPSPESR